MKPRVRTTVRKDESNSSEPNESVDELLSSASTSSGEIPCFPLTRFQFVFTISRKQSEVERETKMNRDLISIVVFARFFISILM